MQLERFDEYVTEVRTHLLHKDLERLTIYRFFNRHWFNHDGARIEDEKLLSALSQVRRNKRNSTDTATSTSYFPITAFDAVVVVPTPRPLRIARRKGVETWLTDCLKHADNAFEASHDALTGLLNRAGFDARMRSAAPREGSIPPEAHDSPERTQSTGCVTLFALDIDHFKQVNDSYGHNYGDLVLRTFAKRLKRTAIKLRDESNGKLKIIEARPGGEEFAVLIASAAAVDPAEIARLADVFRRDIAETSLPTDEEWSQFTPQERGETTLPHISERRVTVSIGTASLDYAAAPGAGASDFGELINKADTALYRAKAGGRDTVREFGDILHKHGRILEHHADTGIVTIDIGRQVGVIAGQEFLVFHPDFCGGVPFIFADGRTKKRLGNYPRIPCGRIVAFDVQNDIAFCRVEHCEGNMRFPAGSALEAAPAGSIAHLLAFENTLGFGTADLVAPESVSSAAEALIQRGARPFVAVYRVSNAEDLTRKRGRVFTTDALKKVYHSLRESFGAHVAIAQTQTAELAVLTEASKDDTKTAASALGLAKERCHSDIKFRLGIFQPPQKDQKQDEYGTSLDPAKALDLARYAAADDATPADNETEVFSSETAHRIVMATRARKAHTTVLADYERFVSYGVAHPYMSNQAALSELERLGGDLNTAHALMTAAIAVKGDVPLFHVNRAYIDARAGNLEAAFRGYARALEIEPKYRVVAVYVSSLNRSALLHASSGQDAARESKQLIRTILENNDAGKTGAFRPEDVALLNVSLIQIK